MCVFNIKSFNEVTPAYVSQYRQMALLTVPTLKNQLRDNI